MRHLKKGFSLVELMITLSILGILAAVAIPAYTNYANKARVADLMSAIHLGELMVGEYLQSTGASDCINMSPEGPYTIINIPVNSSNIGSAWIDTGGGGGTPSCTVIATGNPTFFSTLHGKKGGFDLTSLEQQNSLIEQVQLAADEFNIPYVDFVAYPNAQQNIMLFSVPTISSDGSISWTIYSNGNKYAPSSIMPLSQSNSEGGTPSTPL